MQVTSHKQCINLYPIVDTTTKKGGIVHMDIAEKVYNFMKSSNDKNGFTPTVHQIAEELNIADHEARAAIEQLKESGRIKITDIPRKTIIEFTD